MKAKILQVAWQQKERLLVQGGLIARDLLPEAKAALTNDNRVLALSGMRRTGKSTLLQQLMSEVDNVAYFNFEDEKLLGFSVEHFGELEEALIEVYGPAHYWFFDEIQNVGNFEVAVRRMQDSGKKMVITGSNSSLLSMEFGSKLTGRYKQLELFPFSFSEYLRFQNVSFEEKDFYLPEAKVMLKTWFTRWLEQGGLPEYLKYNDEQYVKTLFDNILYRDIIVRFGIRRHREFRELVQLLVGNLSLPVTFTSLQKSIGLSNADTVKEYMGYLSNAYMFYEMYQYHDSLKMQLRSPRKVYLNDVAFHNLVGFSATPNQGRKLENAVFLALRRGTSEVYSFSGKGECDFIVFDKSRRVSALQVCYQLTPENQTRELNGISEAMLAFNLKDGLILTMDQEFEIQHNGKNIPVLPVWKWMLTNTKN
ncbi:MAG: ATP-binding protein [Lentimicrobium sp.]|uniref:ATP-binding protein n=1 Tax=Lentimicrobium sp. TaxID=2034841 RepID=UPI0025D08DC1|nr:ATP-binding protein [Lentimicrobium sp.]MCO5255507.1 ATP-binding protein [Lentimicrobium sp.]